jgi:hypothetical protein
MVKPKNNLCTSWLLKHIILYKRVHGMDNVKVHNRFKGRIIVF